MKTLVFSEFPEMAAQMVTYLKKQGEVDAATAGPKAFFRMALDCSLPKITAVTFPPYFSLSLTASSTEFSLRFSSFRGTFFNCGSPVVRSGLRRNMAGK